MICIDDVVIILTHFYIFTGSSLLNPGVDHVFFLMKYGLNDMMQQKTFFLLEHTLLGVKQMRGEGREGETRGLKKRRNRENT